MAIGIHQLLAGRDFGRKNPFAGQMANFCYCIEDTESRQCMLVDPAWDIPGLVNYVDQKGLTLVGTLATHYHPDHVGGDIMGHSISGLGDLMAIRPVKVHAHVDEVAGIRMVTGLSDSDMAPHRGGDTIQMGAVEIKILHTPGHTPGSQCFMAGGNLISGDTLFVDGCGRVDLPGSDPEQMYQSLTGVLARVPDDTILYPGHNYSAVPSDTMGSVKAHNHYLRIPTLEHWMRLMG